MRRRDFIKGIAGSAVVWPRTASAQQRTLPTIGFLGASNPTGASRWVAAFVQGLRELGWTEGRNIVIEYRWAEGRTERMSEIAAGFVTSKVNIIVTYGTQASLAAKQATTVVPIVFALPGDPVGSGLVASLARPGGNITGLSSQTVDLAGKSLELLHEAVPGLHRLAIMANLDNPGSVLEMHEVERTARTRSLDIVIAGIRRSDDIAPAFDSFKNNVDALYVLPDALMNTSSNLINALALTAHIPTMYGSRDYPGGLMSYGPSFPDLFRRTAEYVDKILRGAKPADLPVEQPTKFELVINLTTAKALGLTIPASLLSLADELIE
ncbi:MAG: ABC transporter substrate-binding protein [Xanthobacteraceae bacterium]